MKTSLSEYLMKPVERIMNYHTVLKDVLKYTSRACLNTDELMKSLHVMQSIPKKSDDVMNVGMLEGFKVGLFSPHTFSTKLIEGLAFGILL